MNWPLALCLCVFVTSAANARIGLADWEIVTPGGNRINNFSDRSIYLKDGQHLDGLKRWYFYHDHVVGELEDGRGWFVVNEETSEIIGQTDEAKWRAIVQELGLKPKLWTRWWDSDPTVLTNGLFWFLWILTAWYVAIPVLLLVVMVFRRAWERERFNWQKPYSLGALAITAFVLVRVALENWLGSI